jgi:hypothetical protein
LPVSTANVRPWRRSAPGQSGCSGVSDQDIPDLAHSQSQPHHPDDEGIFLAKSFYRYCGLIFRDHGMSWNLARTADITSPRCATEPEMWNRILMLIKRGAAGDQRSLK